MSSVGGFREGEIDGKPFLVYTLLTQPDNSSSSSSEASTVSGGNNDLLQPLFICPNLRREAEELKGKDMFNSDALTHIQISISPHFPTTRSGDQHVQDLLDSDKYENLINSDDSTIVDIHGDSCKLPLVPLFWCNNQESASTEFECSVCWTSDKEGLGYLKYGRGKKRKYTHNKIHNYTNLKVVTMSSVGGFREGEIDGKPFLIFTFLTQPDHLSSSSSSSGDTTTVSGGNNDLLQPLFICPTLRSNAERLKREEDGYNSGDTDHLTPTPMSIPPHFPTTRSGDQQVQLLLDSDSHDDICKLPLVPLFWCNQESASAEFGCTVCQTWDIGTHYIFCVTCCRNFHKECVESPFEIKYPSYPFHSFQLSYYTSHSFDCLCCGEDIHGISYISPTTKLSMHPVCAMKPIPMLIDYPKRHHHRLTFFPKQAYLPCNVCGLIKGSVPTYLCLPCVFVVHQDCAYFPSVIKISRHHHRISFTSSLPSGQWFCGVCRKEVDNHYGAYSCNKCDDYFVHSRCALRRDLWDGVELEGVPEEPEIVVEPFKRIADGIILHFSHDHLLKLEINRVCDEDKFCSACILPVILKDGFYSCMDQCDFILHEVCANAPRKKHHPLHAQPLTLKVVTNGYNDEKGYFDCNACLRSSCGFVYESDQGSQTFRLDLRCAMVSEPFKYEGHEDPLFLALTPKEEYETMCQICQETYTGRKLNCIKCDYVICFKCATLPYKARYKHDKHLLTFQKEKESSDEFGWCELCEKELVYSEAGGYYTCDDCCTTLHVDFLLGEYPYMRAGQTIRYHWKEIHIVRNNTMSRPFCHGEFNYCGGGRCPYGVVFIMGNKIFCSLRCA